MLIKRIFICSSVILIPALALLGFYPDSRAGHAVMSSALEQSYFYITVQEDTPVSFSCEELELRLGLEKGELEGLTVTGLPDEKDGVLMLGGEPAQAYVPLNRKQARELLLIPTPGASRAGVSFIPKTGNSVPATVYVNITQRGNTAPLLGGLELRTMGGVTAGAYLDAWDPDGDPMSAAVIKAPKKGSAVFDGLSLTYTPYAGKTGKDSLTVRVYDSLGAYSDEAVIDIAIDKPPKARFSDMQGDLSEYHALRLSEAGVMTGERIGETYLFYPQRELTRADFIVALFSASGLESGLMPCVNTGLNSDSAIQPWQKPYIKAALDKGIIAPDFIPGEAITRAQAAAYICAAMNPPPDAPSGLRLTDLDDIPSDALSSYAALSAAGMLHAPDGKARPMLTLTRAYAARLLLPVYLNREYFSEK